VIPDYKKYINYLDKRPQSHGLFSLTDEPIVLEEVAEEIASHQGFIWTHIVSLKRDDTIRTVFENLESWKNLVRNQIKNIAESQKISLQNLKWYAAFHDKKNNPHVHIILYSNDIKEGFLTNKGIEKIRSCFANEIYKDELHFLYERQTQTRDLIKQKSRDKMREIIFKLDNHQADKKLTNSF
jgi:hypothetical protein